MEARVRVSPLEQTGEFLPLGAARLRAQPQAQRPHQAAVVVVGSAAPNEQELQKEH